MAKKIKIDLDAELPLPGPDVSDTPNQAIEGLEPRVSYQYQKQWEDSTFDVDGVKFEHIANLRLPRGGSPGVDGEPEDLELGDINRFALATILCQRGLQVCGADDHFAADSNGNNMENNVPFYAFPKTKPLQHALRNEVNRLLGGNQAGESKLYFMRDDIVLDPLQISEVVDFVLTEERFAALADISAERVEKMRHGNTATGLGNIAVG